MQRNETCTSQFATRKLYFQEMGYPQSTNLLDLAKLRYFERLFDC